MVKPDFDLWTGTDAIFIFYSSESVLYFIFDRFSGRVESDFWFCSPLLYQTLIVYSDMEGVHSYVEGICGRDGLVGVVEDDMEGVHSSQFLGKNGEEWANGGSFLFL
ncbi:hypothetical protein Hanom_Chr02g00132951 [Helianthus anomalus]